MLLPAGAAEEGRVHGAPVGRERQVRRGLQRRPAGAAALTLERDARDLAQRAARHPAEADERAVGARHVHVPAVGRQRHVQNLQECRAAGTALLGIVADAAIAARELLDRDCVGGRGRCEEQEHDQAAAHDRRTVPLVIPEWQVRRLLALRETAAA